jgi:hypothetical protein
MAEAKLIEARHSFVQELAREYTRNDIEGERPNRAGNSSDPNSPLNPRSENFSAEAWAINVVANQRGQRFRQVGLCFQNLSVFGYGNPTDFQKDIANVWLALPGVLRRFFSHTAGQTRINILRQFDGLIRAGEMCVVLGPPGSGW